MKYRCVNNRDHSDILTIGKIYEGQPSNFTNGWIEIFEADDGITFEAQPFRFELVKQEN